jgi:hypothetical protein
VGVGFQRAQSGWIRRLKVMAGLAAAVNWS